MAKKRKKNRKSPAYQGIPPQEGNLSQSEIDKLTQDVEKLESRITDAENKSEARLKEASKDFDEKMKDREIRTTEVLAIFVTLFTFISVNVSIFTRVEDLHSAVWFIGLFTALSLLLLSSLFLLISKKRNWYAVVILLLSLIFLVGLLFATNYTPQWNPKLNEPTYGETAS